MSRSSEKPGRGVNWGPHSMALNHLPPKSPSVSSSSPAIAPPYPGCGRVPSYSSPPAAAREHRRSPSASFVPDVEPSWLEDLLDSPKAPERRVSHHRRSASDSIAFLEAPSSLRRFDDIAEEDEGEGCCFDREREESLVSMFSEMNPFHRGGPGSSSNQISDAWSRPGHLVNMNSRHFSGAHLPKATRPQLIDEQQQYINDGEGHPGDPNADPKRSKRQSAQRSRVRKLQYIHELEGNVNDLQNEVSALATQIALLEHQRLALHFDNAALKQSLAALAQKKLLKDAHAEELEKEVFRMRRLEKQQQQQRLRQQLAMASYTSLDQTTTPPAAAAAAAAGTTATTNARHMRRASASSVHELGSSDALDSFMKQLVEKSESPVLHSSCTLVGNGKGLEVGGRSASIPPGFILQNQ